MTSIVQFRMDSKDKEALEQVLKQMGLDLGTAFRIFAAQVIQKQEIPFKIQAGIDTSTIVTKSNFKDYKRAKRAQERGENISLEEFKRKYE